MKTTDDMIRDTDLICFSHIRWSIAYQRPHHLMSRFSSLVRVFYVEEPVFLSSQENYKVEQACENVFVITPILPVNLSQEEISVKQQQIIATLFADYKIKKYWNWYYTPLAYAFTYHLQPELIIYDCITEISDYIFPSLQLQELEDKLIKKADIVFNSNRYLYQSKEPVAGYKLQIHREKQLYKNEWEKTWFKMYGKIYGTIYEKYMQQAKITMEYQYA